MSYKVVIIVFVLQHLLLAPAEFYFIIDIYVLFVCSLFLKRYLLHLFCRPCPWLQLEEASGGELHAAGEGPFQWHMGQQSQPP